MKKCSVEDCDRKFYAKNFCSLHYDRWKRHGDPTVVKTPDYTAMSNADPDVRLAKIIARVGHLGPDECWTWPGAKTSAGYGQIMAGGNRRRVYVHRETYAAFKGAIPDDLVIDHLCRNRACCNPAHLEAVPQAINVERGLKGRLLLTHCKRGHEYAGDNLIVRRNGARDCRACIRIQNKRRWQKQLERRAQDVTADQPKEIA